MSPEMKAGIRKEWRRRKRPTLPDRPRVRRETAFRRRLVAELVEASKEFEPNLEPEVVESQVFAGDPAGTLLGWAV